MTSSGSCFLPGIEERKENEAGLLRIIAIAIVTLLYYLLPAFLVVILSLERFVVRYTEMCKQ
jgi:hypothetical protein